MGHEEDVTLEPMSIERCRELLGDEANGLSDAAVDQIRRHADAMAHVVMEIFVEPLASKDSPL